MTRARRIVCAALAALLFGCPGPFASPSLVDYPRVLAVVAEAPTVEPGAQLTLTPIVGGSVNTGVFSWSLCVRPELASTGLPLSSFGAFEAERGCDTEGALVIAPPSSERSPTFSVPAGLLTDEAALRVAFGANLSGETLRSLAARAGVTAVASVTWTVDGMTTHAFKRVLIRLGERNTNPAAPSVRINGRTVRRSPARADELCEPDDGMGPIGVAMGARVLLEPSTDESWVEQFTILDASGNLVEQSEGSFRSWFSTAGQFDLGRSRAPDLNPSWVAPRVPGDVTLWLILRDGHGGTSACRWTIAVR
jgi:hypothetical protein